MKLYTRKGDEGFTSLLGGTRARKDDARVEALGSLDELNSAVGLAMAQAREIEHVVIRSTLAPIQGELFVIGARIAALGSATVPAALPDGVIERLERDIDTVCADLAPLKHFVLPRGSELAARLHLARAVSRRAERAVVHLLNPTDPELLHDPITMKYLNRLNDLLFALARLANRDAGESEIRWSPGEGE